MLRQNIKLYGTHRLRQRIFWLKTIRIRSKRKSVSISTKRRRSRKSSTNSRLRNWRTSRIILRKFGQRVITSPIHSLVFSTASGRARWECTMRGLALWSRSRRRTSPTLRNSWRCWPGSSRKENTKRCWSTTATRRRRWRRTTSRTSSRPRVRWKAPRSVTSRRVRPNRRRMRRKRRNRAQP